MAGQGQGVRDQGTRGPGDQAWQATRQVSKVPVVPEGQEALVEEELRQVLH